MSEPRNEPQHSQSEAVHKGFFSARVASLGIACRGLLEIVRTEVHFQIDLLAMLLVVGLGVFFQIERMEWLAVSLTVGLVLVCEAFNTVIERLVDLVHPERHPDAGRVKDMAAGAALVAALCSLVVAGFVFGPRISTLIQR
ncbi:MAG: diacylglycerol kinase family protein [Planctomycetota bacterium]|nr:diacylglycerol kinase family protein [Planctomycetota bacterium]MDA1251870.1 diacylglycerol kinase family protein [Planctomycetota bacterium]